MNITNDHIKVLLTEAKQTTALFNAVLNNVDTANTDTLKSMPYFLKWIDVADLALNNLDSNMSLTSRQQLVEDLVMLMNAPLKGIIESLIVYANNNSIKLEQLSSMPEDALQYKRWALAYITKAFIAIQGSHPIQGVKK